MDENTDSPERSCYVQNGESGLLRTIFLNLLKIFVIVILYFYLSERYGSLSSAYIGKSEFFIQFGASLFALSFLSVLAGPIPAFFSGFLGEILYQFSYYNTVYFHWCIIIGIFGAICGIYKYKPLKYQSFTPILYTILILSIASITTLLLLMIFENTLNIYSFLFQSLISFILLVPFSLFLYDKFLASKENHIYHEFLTHHPPSACDHTFHLQFGRTYVYFCTRCSGFVIGALFSMFATYIFTLIYKVQVSPEIAILICLIFPIPGLVDWGTQRLMLRKSTSVTRLITGFIIGIALHYISYTKLYYFQLLLIIILYFSIFFVLLYFGYKRELRLWEQEMEKLSSEEELDSEFE
jgi:uncharacterized membrane protein